MSIVIHVESSLFTYYNFCFVSFIVLARAIGSMDYDKIHTKLILFECGGDCKIL